MAALSALRLDLQTRFQDKNGGFLSATPANLYLNLGCEEFQNDVQPCFREYGYYITANQFRYDLPADFIHTRAMMWYQTGSGTPMEYLSPQEFKQKGLMYKRSPTSIPENYTIIDNDLYLGPAPASSSLTSTLNGSHTSSVTTITVADSSKFYSDAGIILVESEQIAYQRIPTATTLTLALRGQGGTTAVSHSPGSGTMTVYRCDMVMTYCYSHTYMSADADTPGFSARFHRIPVHYALFLALKEAGNEQAAAAAYAVYNSEKNAAMKQVRRQTRDVRNRKVSTPYS